MPGGRQSSEADLSQIPATAWAIASARFSAIEPLLDRTVSRASVQEQAANVGVDVSTLYRWLRKFHKSHLVSDLLPNTRGVRDGDKRLAAEAECVVSEVVKKRYLNKQKWSTQKICDEVAVQCHELGIKAPHPNTIRRRIASIPVQMKVRSREGSRKAEEQFSPRVGEYPQPERPFADVQIDHTPLDLILVDEVHRQPIGRPWITVAIDIFSRMIAGFYISLDPPGALSTGLCLVQAMLPKQIWLARLRVDNPWPIQGRIESLQCDNAREFHGDMLERACNNYGIRLHWRPVRKPWYGGHIEALLGTFADELKRLPGATFSNPDQRGDYDSDQQAAFTLWELETWLANYITGRYHQKPHSALDTSPTHKYESAMAGQAEREWNVDETRLRLDFMPYVERTVKPYGIVLDQVTYYADILRRWVNVGNPDHQQQKFIVRRDPRDISTIYFYDPELKRHFPVPYRNTAHPPISVWELCEIQRRLKEQGRSSINEDLIFETYARMRDIEARAKRTTRLARRNEERRRNHTGVHDFTSTNVLRGSPANLIDDPGQVMPFEEIEKL